MPRKPKTKPADLPATPAGLLEQFVNGPTTAEAINAATLANTKVLIERALGGELNHHLGYAPGVTKPPPCTIRATARAPRTILAADGPIRI